MLSLPGENPGQDAAARETRDDPVPRDHAAVRALGCRSWFAPAPAIVLT